LERRVFDGQIISADEAAALLRGIMQYALEVAERERALRPPRNQAEVDQAVWAERANRQELQKALSLGELNLVAPLLEAEIARLGRTQPQDSDDYKMLQRNLARALVVVSNEIEACKLKDPPAVLRVEVRDELSGVAFKDRELALIQNDFQAGKANRSVAVAAFHSSSPVQSRV
jgi:hypothetical protein